MKVQIVSIVPLSEVYFLAEDDGEAYKQMLKQYTPYAGKTVYLKEIWSGSTQYILTESVSFVISSMNYTSTSDERKWRSRWKITPSYPNQVVKIEDISGESNTILAKELLSVEYRPPSVGLAEFATTSAVINPSDEWDPFDTSSILDKKKKEGLEDLGFSTEEIQELFSYD